MKTIFASSTFKVQLLAIVSFVLSVIGISHYGFSFESLIAVLVAYFVYGCLGIVVTFHRNFTHRSYVTHPIIEKIFAIFGCLAGTGSSLAWVSIHLNHHKYSDKENDPHSPLYKGIKIFTLDYPLKDSMRSKMKNLLTDPFHQFLHRYYLAIIITWDILLYLVGGFYAVVFLHLLPLSITATMSNLVNYVGHKPGWLGSYKNFNLNDQSVNNWLWALPSWGESWHNNHHRFPKNYSYRQKWWEFDISGSIINLIKIK